jgi:uncharacterized membrane protein (UPF0136 family)
MRISLTVRPQSLDQIAFALGAITAGGGITGFVRTGSIPSIVAGVTIGALVRFSPSSSSRGACRKLVAEQNVAV